jgi:hypothetical protein
MRCWLATADSTRFGRREHGKERNRNMRNKLRVFALGTIVILTVGLLSPAYAWDSAVATEDPGSTDPSFGGELSDPWQAPGTALPSATGSVFWVAIQNSHREANRKTVHLTINPPPGKDLKVNDVDGYYDGGASESDWVDNRVAKVNNADGTITFTATLDPQPDWEVFELEVTDGGDFPDGDYIPEPDGHSNCVQVRPYDGGVEIVDGVHDGPFDEYALNELWIFPETGFVDLSALPTLIVPPHTGEWFFEHVFADPFGEPRPQGGIRWICAGPGLQTRDVFNMSVPMMDGMDAWYWLYQMDALERSVQSYLLATGETQPPDCPEDINGDGVVDLADLAELLAAYGSAAGDPRYNPAADIDQSGTIDLADLAALLAAYGSEC